MPAKKKVAADPVEEKIEKKSVAKEITVYVPAGPQKGLERTFSQEAHGDSYKEVAEQFKKKFNGEYK
jgi:hypothetical protein